jgi:hypothetical protein
VNRAAGPHTNLKYIIANFMLLTEMSMTEYLPLSAIFLALVVGTAISNTLPMKATIFEFSSSRGSIISIPVYAQPDLSSMSPNDFQQLAEDYLSNLTELQNQAMTNESYLTDENNATLSNESDLAIQQLETDVTGNYKNPTYGIVDFVIPQGWYGSERQWSGDKSIGLDMHEGTQAEYMDRLISPPSSEGNNTNEIIPEMTLESTDKAQLQNTQSLLEGMSPISDTVSVASLCMNENGAKRYLEPNSTATIDGKVFDVSTMECTYSSDWGTTIVVSKTYRHETPERIYSLALEVYKDVLGNGQNLQDIQSGIDINKYSPIIDNAAQTLKVE